MNLSPYVSGVSTVEDLLNPLFVYMFGFAASPSQIGSGVAVSLLVSRPDDGVKCLKQKADLLGSYTASYWGGIWCFFVWFHNPNTC